MPMKSKVAFISTGGTIASVGADPLDVIDYPRTNILLEADEILARFPEVGEAADVVPVNYKKLSSSRVYFEEWKDLVLMTEKLVAESSGLAGIVIGHGTSSLEETSFVLNLASKITIPIVMVGAQRPPTALSTDSGMNLVGAVRTAAAPEARGRGVLVVMNDEIHGAREVTKTSTLRLQTFRSPDFGALGHVDRDRIAFYRAPLRRHMPDTEFDIGRLAGLPRVDIAYSYTGSDGAAIRAFLAAGAKGIVSAGFAPGMTTPMETEALRDAVRAGIHVVQASRAGSGRVPAMAGLRERAFLSADNLSPQKARLLLALALTVTRDPAEIQRMFDTY